MFIWISVNFTKWLYSQRQPQQHNNLKRWLSISLIYGYLIDFLTVTARVASITHLTWTDSAQKCTHLSEYRYCSDSASVRNQSLFPFIDVNGIFLVYRRYDKWEARLLTSSIFKLAWIWLYFTFCFVLLL